MHRYHDILTYQWHLSQQHLLDGDTTLCSVPLYEMHKFLPYELTIYLVLFHHLPVVGTLRSVETNMLQLLTLNKDSSLNLILIYNRGQQFPQSTAHLMTITKLDCPRSLRLTPTISALELLPLSKNIIALDVASLSKISRGILLQALASLCWKWHTFFQLSDNGEKIGPYTFELLTVHGLLLVLTLVFILIIRIPCSLACRSRNQISIIMGEIVLSTYLWNGFSPHHLCCSLQYL